MVCYGMTRHSEWWTREPGTRQGKAASAQLSSSAGSSGITSPTAKITPDVVSENFSTIAHGSNWCFADQLVHWHHHGIALQTVRMVLHFALPFQAFRVRPRAKDDPLCPRSGYLLTRISEGESALEHNGLMMRTKYDDLPLLVVCYRTP